MVEREASLSIRRQCELLSVPRRSYYSKPKGESDYNRELMALIDKQYLKDPTYGSRRRLQGEQEKGEEADEEAGNQGYIPRT